MPIFIRIIRAMILTLIFGPCILNTLVSFVKSQLEKVNMLVEHQQLLKECIYSVLSPVIPSYPKLHPIMTSDPQVFSCLLCLMLFIRVMMSTSEDCYEV